MIRKLFVLTCLAVLVIKTGAQTPRVFVLDAQHLNAIKNKAAGKDLATLQLIDGLRKEADEWISN